MLAAFGLAQTASAQKIAPTLAASTTKAAAGPSPSAVSPDAAVITLEGLCNAPHGETAECKTVITRAEFETLMTVLSRQRNGQAQKAIPPEAKRELAIQYSRLLVFADQAEKQGLQDTPDGKELIRFVRLQALTEQMARAMQQKAEPTSEEIKSYYEHNQERYTEWNLQRIVIPRSHKAEDQAKKESLKKLADDLRLRASTGGEFDALEKEAYARIGMPNPPTAKLVLMPGTSLPEAHSAVYRLKPGEVSPVIEDSTGFFIYKLDSSSLVPLDRNETEIHELLVAQKTRQAAEKLIGSSTPTLNPEYFEPVAQHPASNTPSPKRAGGASTPETDQ
jgi:hypothetical protein